jgi:hypothetical protein
MFSDLIGSTVPSARDPEDLREVISAYTERQRCSAASGKLGSYL